jgi:hypothetical protein
LQYYLASAVGQYAVEVTQNGCGLLSECLTVTTIGIEERHLPLFTLSPVPTVDVLLVELATTAPNVTVRILDMTGRKLLERDLRAARSIRLDVSDLRAGAYFVQVQAAGESSVARFVRE